MRFCFLINPTDHWQQAVEHCLHLVQLARSSHDPAVFFYGTAVNIIDDPKLCKRWHDLSNQPLYLCRTMMDAHGIEDKTIDPAFEVIGMAPWIKLMEQADRIVEIC